MNTLARANTFTGGAPTSSASVLHDEWAARRRRSRPSDRWGPLICRGMWDETADVRTFLLAPIDGSRIDFDPGQFMTFRIETEAGTIERCYTIASSAARDGGIEITVKRQPDGAGSGHLHSVLTPGATIEAFGPSGRFGPAALPGERYAFIAAGSGVTPMLSALRTAADRGFDLDAVFVHVTRTEADAIAAEELPSLRRRLPRLVAHIVPSRLGCGGEAGRRLDGAILNRMVPDLAERTVLCCGPDGFMAMVREAAFDAGVPAERYAEETFAFAAPLGGDDMAADAPLRRITFARSGASFDCADTMTILQAARQAGVPIPTSCAQGRCGTCKTFKHSGEVTMVHDGGIRQREIERGFVLPCVSRPLTDIVLDR